MRGGPDQGKFTALYRAYPVSYVGKNHMESGDKVLLPQSALDRLAGMQIQYPMLFENLHEQEGRRSHCGVLEFSADEGLVYMPKWMMRNLHLEAGDVVKFTNVSLPKGRFVKLQPHQTEFIDLENPRAVLEAAMRGYSCLTAGDTIVVTSGGREFPIDILEVRPDGAASVIETDIEVDFAPPLDYKEPQRAPVGPTAGHVAPNAGGGGGTGGEVEQGSGSVEGFKAFTGVGHRMDGRAPTRPTEPTHGVTTPTAPQAQGKVLFGSRAEPNAYGDGVKGEGSGSSQEPPRSVQPFSGKGRSLQ